MNYSDVLLKEILDKLDLSKYKNIQKKIEGNNKFNSIKISYKYGHKLCNETFIWVVIFKGRICINHAINHDYKSTIHLCLSDPKFNLEKAIKIINRMIKRIFN